MHVVLFGPPGSGKGTQAKNLVSLGYHHFSTGELFRKHLAENTPLGAKIRSYIEQGQLVPDEIVDSIFNEEVLANDFSSSPSSDGVKMIFDGYPRNESQFKNFMSKVGSGNFVVVVLEVPEDVLINRLLQRAKTENRVDDTEQVIRQRLQEYRKTTEPVLQLFLTQGEQVYRIDGNQPVEQVFHSILDSIKKARDKL